jgi:eukaryotic-like serine/threonine-protein kinase
MSEASPPGDAPAGATVGGDDLLAQLTDDFLRGHRAGERPSVDEYALKHPHLAGRIRELFPVMLAMEQRGVAATGETAPFTEHVGATVGRYKLLERIGEGGFGVVYMAEQTAPVRRKVALKVIKPGMDSRQVLARFEAERQALAIMDHENIAKVLDAGATDTGRPYFVMELVKGEPITQFCDRNHLAPRQRLELFVQVCRAVQHAHQKGIIHRDIKPSNVMVSVHDMTPVVKVIDFGVAKALGDELTDKTLFTGFAQLVGTPLYMSPEQAGQSSLDVDTRSDIYSLGVLLYELLTGTTPFDKERFKKAAEDEIRRIIREEEPPKPSTRLSESRDALPSISAQHQTEPAKLTKLVRGELDWIVMKALEKDRNRRYETANGFASDIERYLGNEPVVACPPSATYRFRKFARRNKTALAAAILVAASLVIGTAVSIWQASAARRAERLAITETAKATAIADFLQEMLSSANPDQTKGAEYTVRQLLDNFSAGLGNQFSEQPEVEAAIRGVIGKAYWRLGVLDRAQVHLKGALDLRRKVLKPDDTRIAESLVDYAWNCAQQNHRVEAHTCVDEALAIYRRRNARPEALVHALWTKQRFLVTEKRFAEAETFANEALAIAGDLDVTPYADVANILHALADARCMDKKYDEAEKLAHESIALHRRLHGEVHIETAWALHTLGQALEGQNRFDEAEQSYRAALTIFLKHYDDSNIWVSKWVQDIRRILAAKGDQAGLKRFDDETALRVSQAIARGKGNELDVRIRRGNLHRAMGEWDKAAAEYSVVLAQQPENIEIWKLRADSYLCHGQFAKALGDHARSIADHTKAIELEDTDVGQRLRRGHSYQTLGELKKAEQDYRKAIELDPKYSPAHVDLGDILVASNQWAEAAAEYDRSLELDPKNHQAWRLAAYAHMGAGDTVGYHRICGELVERFGQTNDPVIAERTAKACSLAPNAVTDFRLVERLAERAVTGTEAHGDYRYFAQAKGLAEYRAAHFAQAIEWLGRFAPAAGGNQRDAIAFATLAMAHHRLSDLDQARQSLSRARDIIAKKPQDWQRAGDWFDWLHSEMLVREAEEILAK